MGGGPAPGDRGGQRHRNHRAGAQNGIGAVGARDSYIADNDVARNNGWGIHLWRSSRNIIARNRVDHTRRCESQVPAADCGAAAVLLREASDSNTIADNDLTGSSLGLLLAGAAPAWPSPQWAIWYIGTMPRPRCGPRFTAAFGWGNTFLDNRADSAGIGFRLDHSGGSTIRGNTVIGARTAGIVSDHGTDNAILANVLIGGAVGIKVGAPEEGGEPSRRYRIDDNVLARLEQGIVLEQTTRAQLRGNLFDGVGDGLVLDGAGHAPRSPATFSSAPPAGSSMRPTWPPAGTTGRRPTPRERQRR